MIDANERAEYENRILALEEALSKWTGGPKRLLTREAACELLEQVIDTLCEVGNGVTDADLHKAADQLFEFRDRYFNGIWRQPSDDPK
jgi:hypothetical protein